MKSTSTITIQKTIIASPEYVLYHGTRGRGGATMLVKTNAEDNHNTHLLQHEYEVMRTLQLPFVPEVLGIEPYQGSSALLMKNGHDVESLEARIERGALSVEEFLHLSIELAEAVGVLHQHRLIHKAIQPRNILLTVEKSQKGSSTTAASKVFLINFAYASRLASERDEVQAANTLAMDLRYISPEQTGRMNRLVDWRSDIYSLGVVLYQMLTGRLPFDEPDMMGMLHAHIAMQPIAPHEIRKDVPVALSMMVLKLLNKTAEDRYQNSMGLKAELEACKKLWEQEGHITGFEIGSFDRSDRFQIPQKLYGREAEITELLERFNEAAVGVPQILLVSGNSGIGKSALVHEVQKPIVERRGYFIQGKFDQFKRNIPYSALMQAFGGLVKQLLGESDEQLRDWQKKILDAVGSNGRVLIDVLPEIEKIIGSQPDVPLLGAQEAQNRFNLTIENFVRCFAHPSHPLVLFIDDLQWADVATLNLLSVLMGGAGSASLFVIGAYRDNEVNATHPFIQTVDAIERSGGKVMRITVKPLELSHVQQLLSDMLVVAAQEVFDIAQLVHKKTEGNPFFVGELLNALYRDGCIWFDSARLQWQWDIKKIRTAQVADNVVDLMIARLRLLPKKTQEILQLAACVGNQFELGILALIAEENNVRVADALWKAAEDGLIQPLGEGYKFVFATNDEDTNHLVSYQFLHDRVQQAAYTTIADEQRQEVHLKIGRLLLHKLNTEEQEERLFDIVNHANEGKTLITDENERLTVARFNRNAAKKAKESAAYSAAMIYAETALELLPASAWQKDYTLTMDVYKEGARAYLLNAEHQKMKTCLDHALQNAQTTMERTELKEMQLMSYVAQGKIQEAFLIGIDALQAHGLNVNTQPLEFPALLEMLQQTEALLTPNRLETERKIITTEETRIVMRLAMAMITIIFVCAPQIFPQFVCLLVQYSIARGHTEISPYFLVWYTLLQLNILGDFDGAEQNRQFTLHLHNTLHDKALSGKMGVMNLMLLGWVRERLTVLSEQMKPMFRSTVEIGDYEFAAYFLNAVSHFTYYSGAPLPDVTQMLREYYRISQTEMKHIAAERSAAIFLQLTRNLSTPTLLTPEFGTETQSENEFVSEMQSFGHYTWLHWFYVMKAEVFCLFDLYEDCAQSLNDAVPYAGAGAGFIQNAIANFYSSLAHTSLLRRNGVKKPEQDNLLATIEQNQMQMLAWSKAAAFTFQHKYELIEAERRVIQKDYIGAKKWYEQSIATARDNQFIQDEALANRRAGSFFVEIGDVDQAKKYIYRAYILYGEWGAVALQRLLERQYPQLLAQLIQEHTTKTAHKAISMHEALDLKAVVKASQLISGEIALHILLEKLLKVVMEVSGAQRVVLVLWSENNPPCVQADGAVNTTTTVLQAIPLEQYHSVPSSLILRSGRSQEVLVLHNASGAGDYTNDTYIRTHAVKSVLSLPVINQGKLVGVLYAENKLSTDTFTEERVEVLQMLSSQIAISIDNALLIEQMTTVARIKKELEMAANLQLGMLPKSLPEIPGYALAANLKMAREAGGDFYDVIKLNHEEYMITVGDVSGKGMPAALYMSAVMNVLRTAAAASSNQPSVDIAEVIKLTNHMMRQTMDTRNFVTVFVAILNVQRHELRFTSAGHDPAILWNATTRAKKALNTKGQACGFVDARLFNPKVQEDTITIQMGEYVVWNTDGVTESKNILGEEWTDEHYWSVIENIEGKETPHDVLEKILEHNARFVGQASQYDDMTLVCLQRIQHSPATT